MKKLMIFAVLVASVFVFALSAGAEDITGTVKFTPASSAVTDGSERTYSVYEAGSEIRISSAGPRIAAVYVKFDREPPSWMLTANGVSVPRGRYGFWHEFCDVAEMCGEAEEVTLSFDGKAEICDIYVFSAGEIPDWVQRWEPADGYADLMLMSTHADDEQLFFLGVLPYYAGELDYEVQVVYFTNHLNTRNRPHELLNGLWTVGVKRYPVIGSLTDHWDGYTLTREYSYSAAAAEGLSRGDLIAFQVSVLRRFRPQVVVGHDIEGEYGHPQHKINTDTLIPALTLAADASYMPESAAMYGVWDVPKTYLHLYDKDRITMDWDRPLSHFGGMTAYEVSKLGYACHLSQQYTWFTDWINGKYRQYTKATDIRSFKPTEYGLYRTLVGSDTVGGDFFENLTARSTLPLETEPVTEPVTEPPVETPADTSGAVTLPPESTPATVTDAEITADAEKDTGGTAAVVVALAAVTLLLGAARVMSKNKK